MPDQTNPRLTLSTSMGDITLELFAAEAPETVANFLNYAHAGHYDNVIFHRVIPGFMIQGGGFTADMRQKPTGSPIPVSYTHLRAHETPEHIVCRILLEQKNYHLTTT